MAHIIEIDITITEMECERIVLIFVERFIQRSQVGPLELLWHGRSQ